MIPQNEVNRNKMKQVLYFHQLPKTGVMIKQFNNSLMVGFNERKKMWIGIIAFGVRNRLVSSLTVCHMTHNLS